jgi:hypothetical protein
LQEHDRSRSQALEGGSQQTQFPATGLLDEQIGQRAARPAAAGQFSPKGFVAARDDPRCGAGKLVAPPEIYSPESEYIVASSAASMERALSSVVRSCCVAAAVRLTIAPNTV